jgi:hypothetical protein
VPRLRVLDMLAEQRVEPAGPAQELDRGSVRLIEPRSIWMRQAALPIISLRLGVPRVVSEAR